MDDKYNGNFPKAWTQEQIEEYQATGNEPPRSSNGVWVTDLQRDEKDLIQWSVAELFALYNKELNSDIDPHCEAFEAALKAKVLMKYPDGGRWSTFEMYDWLATDKEPPKTASGNFMNDPTRFEKDVHLLNDSELVDFGLGYFGEYERSREYVLVEALERFNLPVGTTFEEYAAYCAHNDKPLLTPRGSLINDRLRSITNGNEWSDDEVLDWVDGLIEIDAGENASLLSRAIKLIGGEWYWSFKDLQAYSLNGVIPEPEDIDISGWSAKQITKFIRETKSVTVANKYVTGLVREDIAPGELKKGIPVQWSVEEAVDFLVNATIPARWSGLWCNDVRRATGIFTEKEIEGVYRNTIVVSEEKSNEVLDELYAKLSSEQPEPYSRLDRTAALELYFDKIEPIRNEAGALKLDMIRERVAPDAWSDEDIRALLKGELVTQHPYDINALINARTLQWLGIADIDKRVEWFIADSGPTEAPNGVFVEDPRRVDVSIRDWSDKELVALVNGWITPSSPYSEEEVIAILFDKGMIKSMDWSYSEVAAYLNDGTVPEKTEAGSCKVKYDDKTITRKSNLSFFRDWAEGEVELPNPKEVVLNRVREIIGASNLSDEELITFLKKYDESVPVVNIDSHVWDSVHTDLNKVKRLWNLPADADLLAVEAAKQSLIKSNSLTSNGVLVEDTRRHLKAASLWTVEELRSWARGEIPISAAVTPATLANAMRHAIGTIDARWDDLSVKKFVADGTLPAMTSTGVLVVDISRDKKWPSEWSDEELKGYLLGEIKTPVRRPDILLAIRNRFKVPGNYSEQELCRFVLTGEERAKEPVKAFTSARTATDEQLKAWLTGDVVVSETLTDTIFNEIRCRFKTDPHWTNDDIVEFYKTGAKPSRNNDGLFINDRLRDVSNCSKWSLLELKALANGEIKAPKIATKGIVFQERARKMISLEIANTCNGWSDDEVLVYLRTGEKAVPATGNVFVNDPKRINKDALGWSNAELKAWLRKEVEASQNAPDEDLWNVVYQRFQIPMPWYQEDARSYVLTGATVPATPSGIWIRDRERDLRPACHWSRAEIKAWCRGQVLAGLKSNDAELLQHAATCFNMNSRLSAEFIKLKVASITEDTTPMTVAFVREDLLAFAAGMKSEGAIEARAAMYQQMLNRCIQRVCKLKGQDFVDGWTELLKFYYNQRNELFTAGKMYNGVSMMAITAKQQKYFQHITTVLHSTCDPEKRDAAVKRIDWSISLSGLNDEDAKHQIMAFYNIG